MKLKWAALILTAAMTGVGCSSTPATPGMDKPSMIKDTDAPWGASNALYHDYPDAQIQSVEKIPQADGSTHYDFKFTTGGKNAEAAYGTFGDRSNQ